MAGVIVVPYSAQWPQVFADIRTELQSVFVPTPVRMEHIGSTAVAGLSAKPVIDVLLGAQSLGDVEAKIPMLESRGYGYVSKYERELPQRRYFVRALPGTLRVHLHAVVLASTLWREHLAFRDALRSDASLREAYQALKLALAAQHAADKSAYTEAKGPFIKAAIARALGGAS